MIKTSVELFRVHSSFKVKFSLVIRGDEQDKNFNKLINKFNFNGNTFLKITPFPFITIDITSRMDKNEEWSTNRSFNMNRRDLFNMIQRLRRLYSKFTSVKDLFYFDNDVLKVNNQLAFENREIFICSGNKTILMQACVVESSDNNGNNINTYEGIFLSINSMDYFSYLTYAEVGYLIYELQHIDMSALTLQTINTYYLMEKLESEELKITHKENLIESKEDEIVDVKPRILIQEPNVIPDI